MEVPLYIYRCERCCALFCLKDPEETRGGHNRQALLEANDCPACDKGVLQYLGTVQLKG